MTNHIGRKTLIKKMKHADIPKSLITKITSHKATEGVRSYEPGNH